VNRLKTIVAMILLVLWAPVTSHCLLERVPGLEFLACASDDSPTGDCDKGADGCQSVESASYKTEDSQPLVSAFAPALALLVAVLSPDSVPPRQPSLARRTDTPPDIPSSWQFALRTALPVRAPSVAS
jgi:hypothetical protein